MPCLVHLCLGLCATAILLAASAAHLCVPAILAWRLDGRIHRALLPLDLPGLLLFKGRSQTRTLGLSAAGDRGAYREVNLTLEQKQHYFEHGYVVLRGVVEPRILDAVRAALWREIGPASWPWAHSTFMTVDAALDFYIFSNLPSLAAQLFASPETDVEFPGQDGKAVTHFYSDFHYFRPEHLIKIVPYHSDENECEGAAPASHVRTSRLRMWVTLDDEVIPPILINQSYLVSFMKDEDRASFFAGRALHATMGDYLAWLQRERGFPETARDEVWTVLPRVSRGDVVLHSPCLMHGSPPPLGRAAAFLCVTYAPGESRAFTEAGAGAPCRTCRRRNLRVGDQIGFASDMCMPRVHPPHPKLTRGRRLRFEAVDYDPWAALNAWLLWRRDRVEGARAPDLRQPSLGL